MAGAEATSASSDFLCYGGAEAFLLGHLEPHFLPPGGGRGEQGFPGCSEASCSKGHITHVHTMPGLPHLSLPLKASLSSFFVAQSTAGVTCPDRRRGGGQHCALHTE